MMAVSATDLDQVAVPKILNASCVEREHPRAFVFLDCSKTSAPRQPQMRRGTGARLGARGKKSRRRRLVDAGRGTGLTAFD